MKTKYEITFSNGDVFTTAGDEQDVKNLTERIENKKTITFVKNGETIVLNSEFVAMVKITRET